MRLGLSVFYTVYIVDEYFCEFSTCFNIVCLFCRFCQSQEYLFHVFVVFALTTEALMTVVKSIVASVLFVISEEKRWFFTMLKLKNKRTQKIVIPYRWQEVQYPFGRCVPAYKIRRRLKDFSYIVESFCPLFYFIFFEFHNDMFY